MGINLTRNDLLLAQYNNDVADKLDRLADDYAAKESTGAENFAITREKAITNLVHSIGVQNGRLYVVLKSDSFLTRFFADVAEFFGRFNTNLDAVNQVRKEANEVISLFNDGFVPLAEIIIAQSNRDIFASLDKAIECYENQDHKSLHVPLLEAIHPGPHGIALSVLVHTIGVQENGKVCVVMNNEGFFTRLAANFAKLIGSVDTSSDAISEARKKTASIIKFVEEDKCALNETRSKIEAHIKASEIKIKEQEELQEKMTAIAEEIGAFEDAISDYNAGICGKLKKVEVTSPNIEETDSKEDVFVKYCEYRNMLFEAVENHNYKSKIGKVSKIDVFF